MEYLFPFTDISSRPRYDRTHPSTSPHRAVFVVFLLVEREIGLWVS